MESQSISLGDLFSVELFVGSNVCFRNGFVLLIIIIEFEA